MKVLREINVKLYQSFLLALVPDCTKGSLFETVSLLLPRRCET
jgi:hypothetical protein